VKTYTPKKPVGNAAVWTWRRWLWDLLAGGHFPLKGDGNITVQWQQGVYRISSKPTPATGGSGFPWMYPTHKELDPTLPYAAGYCAYISPFNDLVQVGLMDLVDTGVIHTAIPGIWLAVKAVPPQAVVAGVMKYNVPQLPLFGATGLPAGTPLKGDADGTDVFWIMLSPAGVCF